MRKKYLDNIRTIIILSLFLIHTLMIWNNFGLKYYIWDGNNNIISSLIILFNPWIMPTLFLISGISTRYSLEKRTKKEYIKERITKLLIPLISGIILLIPILTLIARKYFYNYTGGFIENLKYFFTHITDLTGYDGAFTPGHLWFILFLFIISIISLIIIKYLPYEKVKKPKNIIIILSLFIPIYIFYFLGNFGGKSLGQALILFLLGYYLFDDSLIEKLKQHKKIIIPIFIISQITLTFLYYKYGYYGDFLVNFVGWLGILTCLIIGSIYLDKENKLTIYLKKASYPIYIIHLPILIVITYYILTITNNIYLQIFIIMFGSLIITLILYEILKRIPYIRKLIGIK